MSEYTRGDLPWSTSFFGVFDRVYVRFVWLVLLYTLNILPVTDSLVLPIGCTYEAEISNRW